MIYGVFYYPQESESFRNFWHVFRNPSKRPQMSVPKGALISKAPTGLSAL
ncbi:hypothetical protein PG5_41910 [Pseudomonas sp. G5(2012)]|nr:hypothetical protein PG5_41910 [Pseudomonas sp. G5(2012)]